MAEHVKYLDDPYKSENDKKIYKSIELNNGLRALIVSVPTLNIGLVPHSATCALMVDHGPFADPRSYQGLAHFLEHMIFMGSKPDSEENVFFAHVKKNGGECSSSILSEDTLFSFKDPLMLQDTMERGRVIVDSEFQQVATKDSNRRNQLLASLATEGYPHGSFNWGNMKSLKDNVADDNALHKALHDAWRDNYAANRMYVCLQGSLSIDVLESMVVRHFSKLRRNDIKAPDLTKFDYRNAFRPAFHEQVFLVEAVEKWCKLELTWVLPSMRPHYHSNPDKFLSNLIGYKGDGSLLAYLERRHWACHLDVGIDETVFNHHSMHAFFKVNIGINNEGFKHIDEVLFATFAYLQIFSNCVNGSLHQLYEEQQKSKAAEFRLPDRLYRYDVDELVFRSKYYPPKDVLTARKLTYDTDEQHLSELIGILNSFKFNLMITSQKPYKGIPYDKQEEWFGTKYTTIPMPAKWKELWLKSKSKRIAELFLPEANPFVAHDFTLFWNEQGKPKLPPYPKRLVKTDTCELWFRQDDKFGKPQAYLCFFFITPLLRQSAKNAAMCDLYVSLVQVHVQKELELAQKANLNCRFMVDDNGLRLFVSGYNEKLHLIVEAIAEGMVNVGATLFEGLLTAYRQIQGESYLKSLNYLSGVSSDIFCRVLGEKPWATKDMYKSLDGITLEDMKAFAQKLPQELYIKALIQGNYTEEAAHKVLNAVLSRLKCEAIRDHRLVESRIVKLPQGGRVIYCDAPGEHITTTNVTNYYQFGANSLLVEVILDLMSGNFNTPHFYTEKLVGGEVEGWVNVNNGIIGYYLTADLEETAAGESAKELEKDIEVFFRQGWYFFDVIDDKTYAHIKEQLIDICLAPSRTLLDERM
ncbi:nardilysin-like [Drosophila obscura]|uniref:nardilysin-like n=1 Tax=Drosophila obscura TaxID=7282 RepID=UPI001BB2C3D9|nr:nardilysin-like [Drosophila obscura]